MSLKLATIALALNCCALFGADYFPLRSGNTWTYREAKSGQTFTVHVGAPAVREKNIYYELSGYVGQTVLARIDASTGALVYWDDELGKEIPLTLFEQTESGWWTARFRPCPDQDAQGQMKLVTHDGPAGPFSGALQVKYRVIGCADVGVTEEQYAPNIGLVRRVETSFAGPRTFDLIAAHVGNLSIEIGEGAKFSVSYEAPKKGNLVPATFRLQTSGTPLTLKFASGQEYDFALKDTKGNTLWQWSNSAMFVQSLHERTVDGEWTATVDVPWPQTTDGGIIADSFVLQAWVTTVGDTPQFIATTPATLVTIADTPTTDASEKTTSKVR